MWSFTPGSLQDDGADPAGGAFNQSAAFTCNIVAAKVVQCVKGAAYTSGVVSSIGNWASGSTFIEYGDPTIGIGRIATLMGYNGGQRFPVTSGSGYTNGTWTLAANCGTQTLGGVQAMMDLTIFAGALVNAYPSTINNSMGLGLPGPCTISPNFRFTASIAPWNWSQWRASWVRVVGCHGCRQPTYLAGGSHSDNNSSRHVIQRNRIFGGRPGNWRSWQVCRQCKHDRRVSDI
jgi:hypothetical protein